MSANSIEESPQDNPLPTIPAHSPIPSNLSSPELHFTDLSQFLTQFQSYYNNTASPPELPRQTVTIKSNSIQFRLLERNDFNNGYLSLLAQLTKVGEPSLEQFQDQYDIIFNNMNQETTNHKKFDYFILVGADTSTNQIIATATLLIEYKFIRNLGRVGHIEDVVVDTNYRHQGIGLTLIHTLTQLSQLIGCYKSILDCTIDKENFYALAGYSTHSIQMSCYKPA